MSALDLSAGRLHLHVVGVGGTGMSALATALVGMGHQVSGSDLKDSGALERLSAAGVRVTVGHEPSHVTGADVVVISSAIPAGNIEVVAAHGAGIPVASRAQALAGLVAARRSVAIAGTHGKTTTSSMLTQVLVAGGFNPSFVLGGELNESGASAAWGDGDWLVVEADESDGTFLVLHPEVALVTNIEPDHLEHYGGFDELVSSFGEFLADAPRALVCTDDPIAARLGRAVGAVGFGHGEDAAYRAVEIERTRQGSIFALLQHGNELGRVTLAVPGALNVSNALAAAAVAMEVGASFEAVASGLGRFAGVARRFQLRGEREGITVIDDYAHLPGEVRAALAAASEGGWARVVAVFQPHRYSRTASLAGDFAAAFDDADVVVITDVYPAGEAPRPGVSGRMVAEAVEAHSPSKELRYVASRAELAAEVRSLLQPGDVCVVLGAGDVALLADELLERG